MEIRKRIGLIVLINFVLPLHVLIYFGAFNFYFDYAMNLCYLSFLVFGSTELETDKREFKSLSTFEDSARYSLRILYYNSSRISFY